ncbi:hypothetical protein E2C01_088670 [Portunus trituberculatus]|uniref:Uncharacterized protein n=1 Tax=Portunus trituberculatus TaxID=210409 RepID=A0A5B7JK11_PORTR|nr:hypothetical protein [Portunus trituberculatus]
MEASSSLSPLQSACRQSQLVRLIPSSRSTANLMVVSKARWSKKPTEPVGRCSGMVTSMIENWSVLRKHTATLPKVPRALSRRYHLVYP